MIKLNQTDTELKLVETVTAQEVPHKVRVRSISEASGDLEIAS